MDTGVFVLSNADIPSSCLTHCAESGTASSLAY